jgi:hypothetical protein
LSGVDPVRLFAYGTLRQPEVQRATFGRLLEGRSDALSGYRLEPLDIGDERVIALSGLAVHQAARPTGDPDDFITGTLFLITAAELAAADGYEVEEMIRIEARLVSGATAWVYVRASST